MTKPLVKICGLSTIETVQVCISAKADFIGFVAYPKSPRHLSPADFARLAMHAGQVPTVLVTVNATDALLDDYMEHFTPTYVQCHGAESPQRLKDIRSRKIKIIKALAIAEAADLEKIVEFQSHADIILLDAKPISGELPGGNAKQFDWGLLAKANLPQNWMLSGGLNPYNIATAITQTHAPMVDVSSGVESSAGVKDAELIRAFLHNIKK